MDTLDKYLVKELLTYFIFVLLGLAVMFVAIDFLSKFWMMGVPFAKVIEMYGYKVPSALQQFVPVACLMATLLVLSNMSRLNEVLALYAGGISTFRVVSTFVAVVATLSTISFLIFDPLVPTFEKKRILMERGQDPTQENLLNFNKSHFWYRSGRVIYNVGHFDPKTNTLEDVNLYLLSNTFEMVEKYKARRATYENNDWTLQDGFMVRYPANTHFPESEKFDLKRGLIPEKPSDYKTLEIQDETMPLKDLRTHIKKNSSYGMDVTGHEVNYHKRVSVIFTPIILVLLGISFSMTPLKSTPMTRSIGYCFLIVFVYFLLQHLTAAVGKGGHFPPVVAGWAPNFIFFSVSMYLLGRRKQA